MRLKWYEEMGLKPTLVQASQHYSHVHPDAAPFLDSVALGSGAQASNSASAPALPFGDSMNTGGNGLADIGESGGSTGDGKIAGRSTVEDGGGASAARVPQTGGATETMNGGGAENTGDAGASVPGEGAIDASETGIVGELARTGEIGVTTGTNEVEEPLPTDANGAEAIGTGAISEDGVSVEGDGSNTGTSAPNEGGIEGSETETMSAFEKTGETGAAASVNEVDGPLANGGNIGEAVAAGATSEHDIGVADSADIDQAVVASASSGGAAVVGGGDEATSAEGSSGSTMDSSAETTARA